MNYTETEAKVREATNDDPWGPSGFDKNKNNKIIFNSLLAKISYSKIWIHSFEIMLIFINELKAHKWQI